jgi:diguanylate cyclase (GGDEF)-like protein
MKLAAGSGLHAFGPRIHGAIGARHRLAIGGLALALACGVLATGLARLLTISITSAFVAVLSIALVTTGLLVGRKLETLERRSLEDPVTHVGTRRHWEERLAVEVERAVGSSMPLSVVMLDVDHLKQVNDAHGHACGDRALALLGEVLLETCRSRDVPARFGGDEFAVLLPRTRASEAKVLAERIRTELVRRRGELDMPGLAALTVSIGIAELGAVRQPRTDLLFEAADKALYRAKEAGRDRIEVEEARCISGVICLDEVRAARQARANATRGV